jgi:glycosyltransferase involved in cell wall biosynthesis
MARRGSAPGITVVIPARNEEGNLKGTIQTVVDSLEGITTDYEIVVVNDGSSDGTGALADRLASEHPSVVAVHHPASRGFAEAYRHGMAMATKPFVALIPGDNEIQPVSVRAIFEAVGTADVVVPVTDNQRDRPWLRRTLSRIFTGMVNGLFGFNLSYFQGPCVYPTDLVRQLPTSTTGFVFLTEMLVRALATGRGAVQVPMLVQPRQFGSSSAVSFYNVVSAIFTLGVLVRDVKIRRRPLG